MCPVPAAVRVYDLATACGAIVLDLRPQRDETLARLLRRYVWVGVWRGRPRPQGLVAARRAVARARQWREPCVYLLADDAGLVRQALESLEGQGCVSIEITGRYRR